MSGQIDWEDIYNTWGPPRLPCGCLVKVEEIYLMSENCQKVKDLQSRNKLISFSTPCIRCY